MPLNYNDSELQELIINHFDTLADYQAAYQSGFISGTDITFIDENIQADWTETDSGSPAFIKHKPTLGVQIPSFNPSTDNGKVLKIVNGNLVWSN
jgi:hypothetical protein